MKTYTYQELKDSRIVYDKNPPKLMIVFVFLIVALITAIIILAINTNKTYIVKGQGLVQSLNKQYIMSPVSGQIIETDIKEGQKVNKGDKIAVIKSTDLNLQKQQFEQQIALDNNRITLLDRLANDIKNNRNSFKKNDSVESEFYNRLDAMYTSQKEYIVDPDSLKKQGYTDDQIKQYQDNGEIKKQGLKSQLLDSTTKEKAQFVTERDKLQIQVNAAQNGQNEYVITASTSGIVHLSTPISNGMVLQAGNAVGTLSGSDDLYFETYISSADRARISENQNVTIVVNGLMQSEYGVLTGKIVQIDSDATIDQNNGNVTFKAKVKPDANYLSSKKGDKVFLSAGMTSEVRINYDKISYFKYVLDGLGIKL